jgi:uncharacterized sulfatase
MKRLLAVLLLSAYFASFAAAAEKPNVVMLIADDQMWADYGFMGHPTIRTPNLDELARQSVVFTRGYVPSSLCRPSLATMITGLYPHQHQITGNDEAGRRGKNPPDRERLIRFIDQVPTLPRLLAKEGYLSHQSGKWWEGHYRRGGFTHGMTRGGRHGDEGLAIGREGMAPVLSFIDEALAKEKPFFVWYAPFLPHVPHNPPQRLLDKYKDKTPSLQVAKYWAMCEWLDETCGQLLNHLDERGVADNTIVVFLADNGWIQDPNGRRYAPRSKRSQYDGGLRTPILIRWPGHTKPTTIDTPVASIDLAPTILAACVLKPTAAMPGVNLLDAQAVAARDAIYGEIFAHDVAQPGNPPASLQYRWIIDFPWKLIVPHSPAQKGPIELYHLERDPHEKKNLAEAQPERVEELTRKLDAWWRPE